jgi:hypothetical protein
MFCKTYRSQHQDSIVKIAKILLVKVKVKLPLCLIKQYTMKTYGGVDV